MGNNNPWFWGGMSRQQFEQELQRNAVSLHAGFKDAPPKPKVDIEAVRARKNALIKAGILKSTAAVHKPSTQVVK